MSENSKIQWTDHTWNPWRGCQKVHPRCKNCYMFSEQKRYGRDPSIVVRTKTWGDPQRWQRKAASDGVSKMVFTCSWSDWFHEDADGWRDEAWAIIKACPNLTFQVLTKRPKRIAGHLPPDWGNGYHNVWLGSSLDPQDDGGMALFDVPAIVRFLSLEPLLGSVDLSRVAELVHWVIVGGESGHGARPCNVGWVREVIGQCRGTGVPCFVKQLGSFTVTGEETPDGWPAGTELVSGCIPNQRLVALKHRKGGDPEEWPDDLRVREFPA